MKIWQIFPGDRVSTCVHTDAWWQGDRFGTVVKVGRKYVHVQMEQSGRKRKFAIAPDGFDRSVPGLKRPNA